MDRIETQKITVEVPKDTLMYARQHLGNMGITETIRTLLDRAARIEAQKGLKELRGSYTPSITVEEMRSWEDDDRIFKYMEEDKWT